MRDRIDLVIDTAKLHFFDPANLVEDGQAFVSWMISQPGQEAIRDFRVSGEVLFVPGSEAQVLGDR